MPADEDYGRRHSILQHSAASPAPTISGDRYQAPSPADRFQQERAPIQNEQTVPSVDRLEPPERFQSVSERFTTERSSSDRLPSGERYQGVSERYPLGECMQTTVSTERITQPTNHCHNVAERSNFQPDRFQHSDRSQKYPDRFTPIQNIGSLDRYHNHATHIDRYSRTNTPTDRYHTLYTDKERCSSSSDRYTPVDKYANNDSYNTSDRHSSQNINTLGRHTPTERHRRVQNERDQYFSNTVAQNVTSEVYKRRERSRSSERKSSEAFQAHTENYRYGHDATERYSSDRFPPIPCPERFATQERTERPERITFTQVPYMAPPSPAPASDRFIPPPPLSPTNTPSPDCYASNTFPSPTNSVPAPERFVPPPPLSPSPTETFSPKKQRDRYSERFSNSPNPADRYSQYQQDRYKDRNQYYSTNERYPAPHQTQSTFHAHNDRYVNVQDRFNTNERTTVPPNPHTPVERYTPQQQEPYYQYDRYPKYNASNLNSSDPYMRRDLAYQHQFRVAVPFQQNPYQRIRYMGTPSRAKCCQYQDCYQLCKSSPCSSSSSSVTSQGKEIQKELISNSSNNIQDVQCQSLNGYQQEKAIQCNNFPNKEVQCPSFHITTRTDKKDVSCVGYVSPNLRTGKIQCRHGVCSSPSVEYVGQSGGRHVCATPPPRGSIGSVDGSVCSDQCCIRRSQNTLAVTVWRSTPTPQPQQQSQQPQQIQQPSPQQQPVVQQQQQSPQVAPAKSPPPPPPTTTESEVVEPENVEVVIRHTPQQSQPPSPPKQPSRAVSLPTSPPERYRTLPPTEHRLEYSQSERLPNRPKLARSTSRKEAIKNFVKRETASFFGVDESNQNDQQLRWLDRRKRLASRTYGPLKAEYRQSSGGLAHRRVVSEITGVQAIPGRVSGWRPDVLPGPSDVPDSMQEYQSVSTVKRKDSVARMAWDGLSYVVTTLTRHRPRRRSQISERSRSFEPGISTNETPLEDDVFFEQQTASPTSPFDNNSSDELDAGGPIEHTSRKILEAPIRYTATPGWKRNPQHVVRTRGEHRKDVGGSRIFSSLLDSVLDNSDRRQYGMGWVGRMFGRSMRKSVQHDENIQRQLDDMEDHRPMFTYWVTTVQVLVLIISLVCYGFGPFGIDMRSRSGQVLVPSLSLQQVDYLEPANFWYGPRAADLIHLGAKFAPCMRIDDKIQQQIEKTRTKERETACCIRNDDSGCVQSSRADCSVRGLMPSNTISTWKKWTPRDAGPGGRISGSVCGLDPKYCDAPASVHPYEWPDDITKWPICRKTNMQFSIQKQVPKDKSAEHMICEVIGHPCCIGIHGMCKITTKEYCDFVKGTFHEEASLCSQVSCLDDVCGMVPFYFPEVPDQFYRLWTSIFLHAGIIQLLVTVVLQFFLMRDLEKLTGSLRIAIIYLGSGIAGNLASAIFVPYRADVGPSGSHFGLLACLIVEVLNAWPMLKHPNQALCKLLSITLFLFVIGLMPWVDNYAHLFGFVFGFLLSYALLPFITFGPYDRQKKIVLIWVCLLSAAFLFICLVLLFYIIPVYDCEVCSYFNCLPFTREFCASQNINFKREEYIV